MADVNTGAPAGASASSSATGENTGPTPTGATKVVKGGDSISFDDLDQIENAEVRAKRERSNERRRENSAEKKAEGKHSDESKDAERAPKPAEGSREKVEPKPKKDAKADEGKEAPEAEDVDDEANRPRAKAHKVRIGDEEHDLPGDAVIPVTVNGKVEEHTLQDLINEFSGKTDYNRKYSDFGVEKGKFMKERGELEGFLGEFFEKSQKDPDAAWDFLAEMQGQDPIAFKENLLRSQLGALRDIAMMDDETQNAWIEQQKLGWREKRVTSKEANEQRKVQEAYVHQARADVMQKYGMDDKTWDDAYGAAKHFKGGKFPKPSEVAAVSRYLLLEKTVKEVVPHLVNAQDYATLRVSIGNMLIQHPDVTAAELKELLVKNYGAADNSSLKAVANKVVKNAQRDGVSFGNKKPKADSPVNWNDI